MITRTLPLAVLQGETDVAVATARNGGEQPEKADVTAIYSDGVSRLELHITDWAEAAEIPAQIAIAPA